MIDSGRPQRDSSAKNTTSVRGPFAMAGSVLQGGLR